MKITITRDSLRGALINLEYETESEKFQIQSLVEDLKNVHVDGWKCSMQKSMTISLKDGEFILIQPSKCE